MERDDVVSAVAAERRGIADLLDGLGPSQWSTPSLCERWTVQDVVAHLTLATRLSRRAAVLGVLRARGDVNRMIGDAARERSAAFEPAELVAQLRDTADSPRRPLGTQVWDPLVDVLVHGQDIAVPLHHRREMPVDRVVPALEHVWRSSFYGATKRFDGLRFVATDSEWSVGSGSRTVEGRAGDLLLLSTGRSAGLAELSGTGVSDAAERLRP